MREEMMREETVVETRTRYAEASLPPTHLAEPSLPVVHLPSTLLPSRPTTAATSAPQTKASGTQIKTEQPKQVEQRKQVERPKLGRWPVKPEDMRPWQCNAWLVSKQRWKQHRDCLIVATPGAGKTDLGLLAIHSFLAGGHVQRIVVVVPSSHLKQQWVEAAKRRGIVLTGNWTNDQGGPEPADTHGMVVTYAQIAANPEASRALTCRPTFLLCDELHHAADTHGWGLALQQAFATVRFRLALSGTPFRSDGNEIPFVSYENKHCRPDFNYGYAEALGDQICRPVIFPTYEGDLRWLEGTETVQMTFGSLTSPAKAARRLRTALDTNGNWLPCVLKAADAKLTELRLSGHPEAGGLVICLDQKHAQNVAVLLRRITGIAPALAVSDDPDSSARIRAFAGSSDRWLVAVKMVSEGVDIPRLRVGVYATNVVSELFFRQVVGRFVRMIPGLDEQSAYLYMPQDSRLVALACRLQEERTSVLGSRFRGLGSDDDPLGPRDGEPVKSTLFLPLSSRAVECATYAGGKMYSQQLVEQARVLKAQNPGTLRGLPETTIAEVLRLSAPPSAKIPRSQMTREQYNLLPKDERTAPVTQALQEPESPDLTPAARKLVAASMPTHDETQRQLKAKCAQLAARLDRVRGSQVGTAHGDWMRATGQRQKGATNAQLLGKLHWLQAALVALDEAQIAQARADEAAEEVRHRERRRQEALSREEFLSSQ